MRWLAGLGFFLVLGCGVVGPPLPPEEIGIEAKRLKQQKASQPEGPPEEGAIAPIDEEKIDLPPLQPVGTQ